MVSEFGSNPETCGFCHPFQTKDLGKLRYFLGIEVAQSNDGVVISQRKKALDFLEETGLMNSGGAYVRSRVV